MEIDQSEEESPKKSDVLQNLTAIGGLSTSIAKLSGSSRIIPSNKDFHFYNNFQEFKNPLKETDEKSKNLLTEIGVLKNLYGKAFELPDDNSMELDDELALDWVVNVNDEIFERFDVSVDEFKSLRKKEEETGVRMMRVDDHQLDNGFQMVCGKKNKKLFGSEKNVEEGVKGVQDVKVATRMKPKIPFHIPTLTRPQDEFKIIVNNSNQPFEHVWLHKSEDGSKFIHPLEKLCVLDFIDRSENFTNPAEPPPIEVTPFNLVEKVKDLKQLAGKLRGVDEFAVDLEHNQYRSFQGLTCLMQISTRTEDFVIDTLKLRIHIGPHLREVFKDPTKRKVMHGADNDILWLQRDFGIYVCNMFDTGQASRVLKLERFSLEYLLNHFCGVKANKEYQNADWRIRPLPHEMMKYAREDTHYLMYIYDVMRMRLLMSSAESDSSDSPLVEVYKRSYDICTQLYEKELLTDDSYLYIYGLQGAELNAQQLAVVSGLCEWRDVVARAEDESTGYVLPNRTLIELAKHMPLTASKLRWVLKSKHPFIEKNLGSIVSIIRHSIQNAAAFEETAEYLKKRRLEMLTQANKENTLATQESEVLPSNVPDDDLMDRNPVQNKDKPQDIGNSNNEVAMKIQEFSGKDGDENNVTDGHTLTNMSSSGSGEVTVQVLKKPTRAFGALLGISTKRKFYLDKREQEDTKLGNIKSTVTLPFYTFTGKDEQLPSDVKESTNTLQASPHKDISKTSNGSSFQDIIILGDSSDDEESAKPEPKTPQLEQNEKNEADPNSESDEGDEPISLSDLSSSFQKCLSSSINQTKSSKVVSQSQPSKVEPFDYESARKEVHFGKAAHEMKKGKESDGNKNGNKKRNVVIESEKDEGMMTSDLLPQGRRRQAFPASGNRSATFR